MVLLRVDVPPRVLLRLLAVVRFVVRLLIARLFLGVVRRREADVRPLDFLPLLRELVFRFVMLY